MKKFYQPIRILSVMSLCMLLLFACNNTREKSSTTSAKERPKIVNIINFIRLLEPRVPEITEDVLYQTVVNQVQLMKKYQLGGTFLLQYDALMDARYQKLLSSLPDSSFEIGAWWELPQPLIEKAGIKWRGRYSWDWHANVGFAVGYTPQEREKIVDVYMTDFKNIFGYYPQSVGSWFIDAHTLQYMYDKYGIVASCNCRDQIGTDGYTLWGGYWNQGYYPSVNNAYMPAQTEKNQIPVPIFRMLGSDPIHQYDSGLGSDHQGVVTMEPVYGNGGGDSTWVDWYFKQFTEGECMEYAYVQVGQENSFTWNRMARGYEIQIPLVARLRNEKKVKVEKLSETGKWFRSHYKTTPATAVTALEDLPGSNMKTVWFNSRYYRANLLWDNNTFRFRDIHLFDENMKSSYLTEVETSSKCAFFTLPFVDGFGWSSSTDVAGLRLKGIVDGKEKRLEGGTPVIDDTQAGKLHIEWPLESAQGVFIFDLDEKQLSLKLEGNTSLKWFLELTTKADADLPFKNITQQTIDCEFKNTKYSISAKEGSFLSLETPSVFRVEPTNNSVILSSHTK